MEHRRRVDAQRDQKQAATQFAQLQGVLAKEIKLKEMFEDKLRDTLDTQARTLGLRRDVADKEAADRSRQALR